MNLRDFLYTQRIPQKYYRHVAFWLSSCIPFFIMGIIGVYSKHEVVTPGKFLMNQMGRFPNLFVDILFTYTFVYYVVKRFKQNKNVFHLVSWFILLCLLAFVLKALLWYSDLDLMRSNTDRLWLSTWFLVINFFNDGSLMRCGLFLGCKTLKNYYSKSEEKMSLIKENATAELQLLKAQVHPHFLFNTLNNIYSFSLSRSPLAASLVLKLSDTLRYMITECEAPLVPLEKEIKMLKDYIGLESVRYGTRLEVYVNIIGETDNKMIAPLLLIPLMENSFKHGTSQMLDRPWIKMNVEIGDTDFRFRLTNSKPDMSNSQVRKNGIGLKNVQKRIQLLYPDRHVFEVQNASDLFDVFITIPIHIANDLPAEDKFPDKSQISLA